MINNQNKPENLKSFSRFQMLNSDFCTKSRRGGIWILKSNFCNYLDWFDLGSCPPPKKKHLPMLKIKKNQTNNWVKNIILQGSKGNSVEISLIRFQFGSIVMQIQISSSLFNSRPTRRDHSLSCYGWNICFDVFIFIFLFATFILLECLFVLSKNIA